MDDLKRQQEHFDSISHIYTESRNSGNHIFLKDKIWEYLFEKIDLKGEKLLILEAMCGFADSYRMVKKHAKFNFIYEAFDYSENMVNEAKKQVPGLNVYHQDVTTFVAKDKYDVILIIGGLHHVYNHRFIVANNVSNALKKNGYLISFEPTHNNLMLRKIREKVYKNNNLFDNTTERGFSTDELNSIMANVGLIPFFQFYPGLLAYILWYNPDAFPFLNIGNKNVARSFIAFERRLWSTLFARYLSFATFSCYKKM